MNIILNIPNTSTKITIEGTQAELQSIVTMLLQISQPKRSKAGNPIKTVVKSPADMNASIILSGKKA